jgi:8-amino-7-oxononanoate synthase
MFDAFVNPTLRRLNTELAALQAKSQYRSLETVPGINLYSNDYLGLASDPRLKAALLRELHRIEQVGATGSRLLSGNSRYWEDLESELAAFTGAESALYFGSGYAANVGLLSALLRPEDTVFSDASNHASIIDGIRLSRASRVIFPHLDLNFLENALRAAGGGERIVVVESIFSMEGDRAPLVSLLGLAERYGASLIVDEAHATGVVGPQGRGLAAITGRPPALLATVHTAGKALAAAGAFVACSETLKHYLINRARTFIFSTALPPHMAAQVCAALRIAEQADAERAHLRVISRYLHSRLGEAGFDVGGSESQIIPVILGTNEYAVMFAEELSRAGFAIRPIRPPTVPDGKSRLRISLTSRITMDDVERLADCMTAVRERTAVTERSGRA